MFDALNHCATATTALGLDVSLDGLKELLKDQFMNDVEYYQSFSDKSVDVIKEMLSFLEDPGM